MAAGYLNKITGACTWHSWQLVTGGDSETVCTESASGWNSNSSSSMSDCLDRDTALQCTLALWVAISHNLANWPKNTAKQRTNVEFSHCFHFYQERKLPPANKHVTDYLVSPYGCHPAPHKSATVQWAAIVCSGGKQWGGSDDSKHKTQTRVTPGHHARLSQLDSNCLFVDSVWRKYASRCANPQHCTTIHRNIINSFPCRCFIYVSIINKLSMVCFHSRY